MEPEIPKNLRWYSTNKTKAFTLESPVKYSIITERGALYLRVGILKATLKEIGWGKVTNIDIAYNDGFLFIAKDRGAKLHGDEKSNRLYVHVPALKVFPLETKVPKINMVDAVNVYHNIEQDILIVELR